MIVSKKLRIGKFLLAAALTLLPATAHAEDVIYVALGSPAHVTCDVTNATAIEIRVNRKISRIETESGDSVHCDHDVAFSSQDKPWLATAESCGDNLCSIRQIAVVLPAIYLPVIWGAQ